jgi:hypothetical protein
MGKVMKNNTHVYKYYTPGAREVKTGLVKYPFTSFADVGFGYCGRCGIKIAL